MPAKIDPNDWDRLYAPNAPRRNGPIGVFISLALIGVVIALIMFGAQYFLALRESQIAAQVVRATSAAATSFPLQTSEAIAAAATEQAKAVTATARAATPARSPILGIGAVNRGGNLRSEPRVVADTVLGLIWPGDQIEFLEQRDVDGQLWYRIRVTRLAPARDGNGVAIGTEGWASATLLSPVAPAP